MNVIFPVMLDVLHAWSRTAGCEARMRACTEDEAARDTDADIAAFSVYTQNANATYRVAKKLREKGKIVIMGGPHLRGPNCKEAFPHCDVVAESICLDQWLQLMLDIKAGRIEPNTSPALHIKDDENRFEFPDNLHESYRMHKWYQFPAIFATQGCPFTCNFCNAFQRGKYEVRDIATVCREIESSPLSIAVLCDATFGLNRRRTMELMEALAPLKKSLLGETTVQRLQDEELLESMAKGGIEAFFVGVESLSDSLAKHGNSSRLAETNLALAIQKSHNFNIQIAGSFIAGLDSDGPESFERIHDFYKKSDMDLMFFDLLTPYPNTALYDEFLRNGRIIDQNWEHYDYRHVVYRPLRMTIEQLIDGYTRLFRRITAPDFILNKGLQIFKNNGLVPAAFIFFGYQLFNIFDARRKEGYLTETRKLISEDLAKELYVPSLAVAGPDFAVAGPDFAVAGSDFAVPDSGPEKIYSQ